MGTHKSFRGIALPIIAAYFAIVLATLVAGTMSGCSSAPLGVVGKTVLGPTPTVTPSVAPAATPAPRGGVKLVPDEYYTTKDQRLQIKDAEVLLNRVVQSGCFKEALSHRNLVQTNGRTSLQVAEHIQSLAGEIPVQMYYRCMKNWKCPLGTSAVAYRTPPGLTIYLNAAYFYNGRERLEWASTIGHESLGHALGGYDHDFNPTKQRPFSVPYSINYAIEKCAKEIK